MFESRMRLPFVTEMPPLSGDIFSARQINAVVISPDADVI
jgi:hypothetical protein